MVYPIGLLDLFAIRYFHFNLYLFKILKYLEGELSLYELLIKSGSEANGGKSLIECAEFYSILNEIDNNTKNIRNIKFLMK